MHMGQFIQFIYIYIYIHIYIIIFFRMMVFSEKLATMTIKEKKINIDYLA